MVIRVFITSVSANTMLKKNQQTIIDTLTAKGIAYELVDISSDENEKLFMRENAKPKDGQANAMPPQIFSDTDYLGDYDAFYEALEDSNLDVFFHLASATQTSEATLTVGTN
ncbi:adapter SH3BGRL-like [Watersipora subatra]|uniref:adapter SH3BGRL-like n=1 Tax=Watersipora subatra TaxID=2589382 RepID=UPI00355B7591